MDRCPRRGRGLIAAVLALGLVLAGCSATSSPVTEHCSAGSCTTETGHAPGPFVTVDGDTVPRVSAVGPVSFTRPGPYAAGETTLTLPGYRAEVEVWYPATKASTAGRSVAVYNVESWLPPALARLFPANFSKSRYATGAYRDVAVAPGRFPLVLFAHGFSGFRDQSTFLTSALATWGFVVAAPDLVDNDLTAELSGKATGNIGADVTEMEAVLALMRSQAVSPSSTLRGHVDLHKVAVVGHSLGGAVSEALASADPAIATFVGLAGATVGSFGQSASGPASRVPSQPGMLMVGTSDRVVSPSGMARSFSLLRGPKQFVTLAGFGHLVFADICEIAPGQGGLLALAASVHLSIPPSLKPLATDGCLAPDTPVTEGWPVVRQAVTAWLRHVFGFDPGLGGLTGLKSAFPTVVARATYAGG